MLLALPVLLASGWLVAGALVRDVPTLTAAFGRTLACVPVLLAVSLLTPSYRAPARAAARRPLALLGLAATGFLVYYVGTFAAMRLTGPALTGLVVSLLPCCTYAVGIAWFSERLHAGRVAGTVVATAAVVAYSLGQPLEASLFADTSLGLRALGLALALVSTLSYALYTYLFRASMADLPSPVALPAITALGALLLAPAGIWQAAEAGVGAAGWALAALLGAGLTAPVFLAAHELVLRRGPLATNAAALVVPFLIRLGSWAVGWQPPPGPVEILLFAACAAGVGLVVTGDQTAREPAR
jgi:drug/metabolite transporter (DMT)-like permease